MILSLKNISKSFGKKKILDKINLNVEKGNVVGIFGPSGAGKSVLLKIIIGFLKPDSGKRTINAAKDKIGFSMQNNSIYEDLTVEQNIEYFAKIYNVSKKDRKKSIPNILNFMELEDFKKIITKNLSGGTKKRLDIACALVNDPEILVLDEPFLGLDHEKIIHLLNILNFLNKNGTTIIISSHRIFEIIHLCNIVGMLKDNKLKEVKKEDVKKIYGG